MSTASTETFEKLYPRDEAAAIVHLSHRVLTQKAQDGEIDFIRVGNKNLYPESALKEFLARRTVKAAPRPPRDPKYSRRK